MPLGYMPAPVSRVAEMINQCSNFLSERDNDSGSGSGAGELGPEICRLNVLKLLTSTSAYQSVSSAAADVDWRKP